MLKKRSEIAVIIPAAGNGTRTKLGFPKQYYKIGGKTVIEHTISIFLHHPEIFKIVVSVGKDDYYFKDLKVFRNPSVEVVFGGRKRVHSVLSGLDYFLKKSYFHLSRSIWVIIHDASRPFLRQSDLKKVINFILKNKGSKACGGILAHPVVDTIKQNMRGDRSEIKQTIDRTNLWNAVTPQFFPLYLIRKCILYSLFKKALITDEASALEFCGYHPKILLGRSDNLKITSKEDLKLARFYLKI
ncbi:2-C-methyl-D-erythritol 4-phosphate cytidylyltransferase [Candidatus Riesia pediculicola]|uniref:2-C-methyl-D-erythritol 4-phosphate cytidylyltransferase n=1 Tax=Riesia pediculicola (strain USDA) TaxID=515618 RepID=D4G7L3_RIEPU|nr:2-C-methyl-D-erythritol 4-phosphate cytidylyltransferase [Candidatus Riesia pediculicola]ADD79828.1 2-C-methyl-D-erythritol 4-phosphate cytidylyltransferase [Candidatus Riesia pediculicola USDA]ARC53591.1 hypothetical protein AOE55_00230 [Candidatus Riesia pediculicola]QOJ86244.1 2-C-methyl-D-erythritol 4-phosphate cytidylyltransferase [Candidatus Riesia pediculicola]